MQSIYAVRSFRFASSSLNPLTEWKYQKLHTGFTERQTRTSNWNLFLSKHQNVHVNVRMRINALWVAIIRSWTKLNTLWFVWSVGESRGQNLSSYVQQRYRFIWASVAKLMNSQNDWTRLYTNVLSRISPLAFNANHALISSVQYDPTSQKAFWWRTKRI